MKAVEQRLNDENRAVYLPAISQTFARAVYLNKPLGVAGMTTGDLDFLRPGNPLFAYPYALYSAGQAAKSQTGAVGDDMVSKRDRDATIVLGDSGGYQIQTGAIKFEAGTTERMMRWMEAVSDWSMVLDFPTGTIGGGGIAKHIERLTNEGHDLDALNVNRLGLDYNACLLQTRLNNDFFVAHRVPGDTHFLNVLQGRKEAESRHWYEQVRHYEFEGWAFAGAHQNSFSLLISRLLDMRDDGLLEKCGWLHVLGVSVLPIGALLTRVQRAIRAQGYPHFQISYDTSSPFTMASKQQLYAGHTLDASGWSLQTLKLSDIPAADNDRPVIDVLVERLERKPKSAVAWTGIAKRVTVGELRKSCGQAISADGYNLLMHHNVEAMVDAHEQAHHAMFDPAMLRDPTPVDLETIGTIIDLAFTGEGRDEAGNVVQIDPRAEMRAWRPHLDVLRGL